MNHLKKSIIFSVVFFTFSTNYAQRIKRPPYERYFKTSDIGLGIGSSQYFGDIHTFNNRFAYTSSTRWNTNISFTRHLNPYYSLRILATYARIMADDFLSTQNKVDGFSNKFDHQFLRNSHFKNDLKEISFVSLINLKNGFYSVRNENRTAVMPYFMTGFGLYHHAPQTRGVYDAVNNKLAPWEPINTTNDNKTLNLSIPIGFGIRKKISAKMDVSAEICYRLTFTDHLDDIISESYPNSADPYSNRSQERYSALNGKDRNSFFNLVALRQGFPVFTGTGDQYFPIIGYPNQLPKRGENGNDAFLTTSLQIRYYFDKKISCPK
jgi:hypothetical protein